MTTGPTGGAPDPRDEDNQVETAFDLAPISPYSLVVPEPVAAEPEPVVAEREVAEPVAEPVPAVAEPAAEPAPATVVAAKTESSTATVPDEKTARTEKAAKGPTQLRRRSSLVVSGLGVLALAAGVALGAGLISRPAPATAGMLSVAVPPTQLSLACPGVPVNPASSLGGSDVELGGDSTTTAAVLALVLARSADAPSDATLGSLDAVDPAALSSGELAGVGQLLDVATPTVLRAQPSGGASAFALAATASRVDSGDLRGLAALACPVPASTSWIVGGTTSVGASSILTLQNSGGTPATVVLDVWGATGPVELSSPSILVPAGTSVATQLEAMAPDVDRLVVRATSSGGQVGATLQVSRLDGLTPNGTDLLPPTAMPATSSVIPGVVLGSSTVDEADPSLVRILNPGDQPATVTLELLGPEGVTTLSDVAGLVVEAGAVADISLGGAPAGTYAARVVSTHPVVVGASLVRRGDPAPEDPDVPVVERAWLTAVDPTVSAGVALPGLGSVAERGVLVVADGRTPEDVDDAAGEDDGDDDATTTVTLTAIGDAGQELATRELELQRGGSVALDVADLAAGAAGLRLDASAPVSSAVVLTHPDQLGELIAVVGAQADPQVERTVAVQLSLP